ncbi:hypothetical protein B0H17DRAFT_1149996 [Mycena rosella]|uniref:Uncharacterized protein n=1 Tax=Mycena rosella TaxID=1033263 RepID=A0AAD7BVN2_MYCRO|nr:hypothetical protein B0H17DRAFT_1149996 [Mycena rosella]
MSRSTRSGTVFSPYDLVASPYDPGGKPRIIKTGISLAPYIQASLAAADRRADRCEATVTSSWEIVGGDIAAADVQEADEWEDLVEALSRPASPLSELTSLPSTPSRSGSLPSFSPSSPSSWSSSTFDSLEPTNDAAPATFDNTAMPVLLPAGSIEIRRNKESTAARRARRRRSQRRTALLTRGRIFGTSTTPLPAPCPTPRPPGLASRGRSAAAVGSSRSLGTWSIRSPIGAFSARFSEINIYAVSPASSPVTRTLSPPNILTTATIPLAGVPLPLGVVSITSVGAHLHMRQFKLLVEFPSGTSALVLSGAVNHGNTLIAADETRFSMTQHAAGGLFRWVRYSFMMAKALLAQKGGKELRDAYNGVPGSRWQWALNLMECGYCLTSKMDSLLAEFGFSSASHYEGIVQPLRDKGYLSDEAYLAFRDELRHLYELRQRLCDAKSEPGVTVQQNIRYHTHIHQAEQAIQALEGQLMLLQACRRIEAIVFANLASFVLFGYLVGAEYLSSGNHYDRVLQHLYQGGYVKAQDDLARLHVLRLHLLGVTAKHARGVKENTRTKEQIHLVEERIAKAEEHLFLLEACRLIETARNLSASTRCTTHSMSSTNPGKCRHEPDNEQFPPATRLRRDNEERASTPRSPPTLALKRAREDEDFKDRRVHPRISDGTGVFSSSATEATNEGEVAKPEVTGGEVAGDGAAAQVLYAMRRQLQRQLWRAAVAEMRARDREGDLQ